MDEFEPEYEDLQEMRTELRDYMLASDFVARATPEETRDLLQSHLQMIRHTGDALWRCALALRRIPTEKMAQMTADQLDVIAKTLREMVPQEEEDE
jgi:hypothetical protein